MEALGAEVIRTPQSEGMQGAIRYVKARAAETPNSFVAGQFENQANPDFHYETTARELYDQMGGQIDAVVIGSGTGGTFTGVARYLQGAQSRAVGHRGRDPRFGAGRRPEGRPRGGRHRRQLHSQDLRSVARGRDHRRQRSRRVRHGEEAGCDRRCSGGIERRRSVFAAIEIARRLGPGKRVATIIPDSAERYLSKDIFHFNEQTSFTTEARRARKSLFDRPKNAEFIVCCSSVSPCPPCLRDEIDSLCLRRSAWLFHSRHPCRQRSRPVHRSRRSSDLRYLHLRAGRAGRNQGLRLLASRQSHAHAVGAESRIARRRHRGAGVCQRNGCGRRASAS